MGDVPVTEEIRVGDDVNGDEVDEVEDVDDELVNVEESVESKDPPRRLDNKSEIVSFFVEE